ncbi:MAG: hypothetical protein NTU63_01945 [Candidatus Pacearchaeota archaeon]|nr:hypothetical protein [Candidatus Pacearchaeota archaeon]
MNEGKIVNLEEKDKKDLIKEFNKRGYLLEDKMISILSRRLSTFNNLYKNPIGIEYGRRNNGERIEIDAIVEIGDKTFVLDAKRTEYDWIFSSSIERPNNAINVVYIHPKEGYVSQPMIIDSSLGFLNVVYHDFAIKFGENKLIRGRGEKISLPEVNRPIHDAIRQILKESKAVLLEGSKYMSAGKFLIPIIVTNARLLYLDFKDSQIDEQGNLTDWNSLKEVKAVGYNFHESFSFNTEQGFHSSRPENIVKTAFIVNINHLKETIEYLSGLHII